MNQSKQHGSSQEPLSDLTYDLMTIIQAKSKGLQAYQQYMDDAQSSQQPECADLIKRIQEDDRRHVQEATQHLREVLSRADGGGAQQGAQGRQPPQQPGMGR